MCLSERCVQTWGVCMRTCVPPCVACRLKMGNEETGADGRRCMRGDYKCNCRCVVCMICKGGEMRAQNISGRKCKNANINGKRVRCVRAYKRAKW